MNTKTDIFSVMNKQGFDLIPLAAIADLEEIGSYMGWLNVNNIRTGGQFALAEDDIPDAFYPEGHITVTGVSWLLLMHSETKAICKVRTQPFFDGVAKATINMLIEQGQQHMAGQFTENNYLANHLLTSYLSEMRPSLLLP